MFQFVEYRWFPLIRAPVGSKKKYLYKLGARIKVKYIKLYRSGNMEQCSYKRGALISGSDPYKTSMKYSTVFITDYNTLLFSRRTSLI